jgi:hypothetical protein
MGLIVDLPVPGSINSLCIIKAMYALLDFLFLAQYETYTTDTISLMQEHLKRFHDNKAVLLNLSMQTQFNLPKLYNLSHYMLSIQLFRTTNNYNTKQSKHLHIDLVKDAY